MAKVKRIREVDLKRLNEKAKQIMNRAHSEFEFASDLIRVLGNTPAALEGYLQFNEALSKGKFNTQMREQVALTVAESNFCQACISLYTQRSVKAGLSKTEIVDARNAIATDHKTDAILKFVRAIVVQRGQVSDADLQSARSAGLDDSDIVETIANVALNIFANYVNHINHHNN